MRSEERRAECKLATKCAPTVTGVQQVAGARARQAAQLDRQVENKANRALLWNTVGGKTPYPNSTHKAEYVQVRIYLACKNEHFVLC